MKVSKATRHALCAAAEMTAAGDEPVTVGAVAARYGISEGALAKVFQQLVRAGLATGTRGIGGGYRLARPPSKITVLDIMRVYDPPSPPSSSLFDDVIEGGGSDGSNLGWLFDEVDEYVRCTYESVTLETLVRGARRGRGAQR